METMRKIFFLLLLSFCVFAHKAKGEEGDLKLEDDCDVHKDCEHIPHAICSSFYTCECMDDYVASPNNSNCLPLAEKVGDKCDILKQCSLIPSAQCSNNTCVVIQATTVSASTTKPKECTSDSQCSSFLIKRVCKNNTCVMVPPSVSPKSTGLDELTLGKPCANDTECSTEGAACINALCKCSENFVPALNLKKCLPKAKSMGDKCVEISQCMSLNNSVCENEKCSEMMLKFFNNANENLPALLIGSTCQTDNECKHLTHALCHENVCQCKDNYITSVSSNSCMEKAKKEGDPCEIDKQCEDIRGSICLQNKCVKPGVVGTKLGKPNSGSAQTVSTLLLAAILFIKVLIV